MVSMVLDLIHEKKSLSEKEGIRNSWQTMLTMLTLPRHHGCCEQAAALVASCRLRRFALTHPRTGRNAYSLKYLGFRGALTPFAHFARARESRTIPLTNGRFDRLRATSPCVPLNRLAVRSDESNGFNANSCLATARDSQSSDEAHETLGECLIPSSPSDASAPILSPLGSYRAHSENRAQLQKAYGLSVSYRARKHEKEQQTTKRGATGEREKEESRKSEKEIRSAHLLNVAFTLIRQSGCAAIRVRATFPPAPVKRKESNT
jgi:hypothetical protein